MHEVYLSLGTNLGNREENLAKARELIAEKLGTDPISAGIMETEPVDVPKEFAELKFLNEMLLVRTDKSPYEVSKIIHKIEDEMGRVRTVKNGPRVIDIDLIAYDDLKLDDPELMLPHPRAMERDFVVKPWKKLIRREMKSLRAAVSKECRALASANICRALKEKLGAAKLICVYDAFEDELDLSEFIEFCRGRGLEIVFPEKRGKEYVVENAAEVDLWVCPGLAFTKSGARIGFGGGWYDRFLSAAKPTARKLGVAYDFQILPLLPQNPLDLPLDEILIA